MSSAPCKRHKTAKMFKQKNTRALRHANTTRPPKCLSKKILRIEQNKELETQFNHVPQAVINCEIIKQKKKIVN